MLQPISCDILQNHITQLGAMEPLIYWAGDHCYLGVLSFDSAARVPVVRRAGRSTCASFPCAAELKLGDSDLFAKSSDLFVKCGKIPVKHPKV